MTIPQPDAPTVAYLSGAADAKALLRKVQEENTRLREALADAIRRPMGVVPESAAGFVTNADLEAAEWRRSHLRKA